MYRVKLLIEDACGKSTTSELEYVVIYDPDGGFVIGGGWIHSPAGAYLANPMATGRAFLGLVSKYHKDASNPVGYTIFHFKGAGLTFNSTSYEWLVVSGDKAIYKGEGKLNGKAGYGFLVSVIDDQGGEEGRGDRYRIKIWDKNNSDALVYDNNLTNIEEDAEPATALDRGAIVIHKGNSTARMNFDHPIESDVVAEVIAYPNPVVDKVTIDIGDLSTVGVKTMLTDAVGKSLLENTHKVVGESLLQIDMSELRPGMYIIQIRSELAYKVVKVLKQ
jgi:hypothetical protein